MADSRPPEGPLTLEDLPDDLLRRCVRGKAPSEPLALQDVVSFSMCSRRLLSLLQGQRPDSVAVL
jgi:hypothetical protein